MKIIVIEDDAALAQLLSNQLRQQRYVVEGVEDGIRGLDFALATHADLLIIDVELPRLDGLQLCQQLRQGGIQAPILLLSARHQDQDKVRGLESGADDYLAKPFSMPELLARVQALLRRPPVQLGSQLTWGPLLLDTKTYQVFYTGQSVSLRPKEYKLLECLLRYQDEVSSYERLFDHIWSLDEIASKESLKAHIKGVRQALARVDAPADLIEVVRGIGIRLNPDYAGNDQTLEGQTLVRGGESRLAEDPPQPTPLTLLPQIQAAWGKFRPLFLERIQAIEQALRQWQRGELTAMQRQQAETAAHALAGSLGTFGYWQGSQMAQQLEEQLIGLEQFSPQDAERYGVLAEQIQHLRQLLRQAPESLSAPSMAQPAPVLALGLDQGSINYLTTLLKPLGISTVAAASPVAAEELLSTVGPAMVLLKDQESSLEEAGLRWAVQQGIPVVMCTPEDNLANRIRARQLGAIGVLPYPLDQSGDPMASSLAIKMIRRVIPLPLLLSPRLIAVDDDPLFLEGLRLRLGQYTQLVLFTDPEDFWEMVQTQPPDICLIDIRLPSFSGFDLCQALRSDARFDQMPIVLITGYPDEAEKLFARRIGANDYLLKATDMDQLWLRLSPFLRHPYAVCS